MYVVFVYGSLRKGMGNHILLRNSEFIHNDIMMYPGIMVSMGAFPAVVKTNDDIRQIRGELYSVDEEIMTRLDQLEGYPSFYNREQRQTKSDVLAWIYYIENNSYGSKRRDIVDNGDWLQHRSGGNAISRN